MKTQVLERSLRILECVAMRSPEPVPLPELMSAAGLNKQTCARLAADLAEAGYLEHAGPKRGYRAGVRAFLFGKRVRYEPELCRIAGPYVQQAAARLETFVTLSQMRGPQRYNLLEANGCPTLSIDLRALGNNDLAFTASGHVFLACMEPAERAELFARHPEILNAHPFMHRVFGEEASREQYLEEVRQAGYASLVSEVWGITAFPVFRDGKCAATLASARPAALVTPERRKLDIEFLAAAARRIGEALSTNR